MILLTGATGFIGSRLLAALLDSGQKVLAVKRSFSNIEKISNYSDNGNLVLFDLDIRDIKEIFDLYEIDAIVHMATEYGRGDKLVADILEANVIFPMRLAELGKKHGVKCFINTDSYFNKNGSSYSNLQTYSRSKKDVLSWLNQLGGEMKVINVILEHVYGPFDSSTKFVESLIQNIGVKQVSEIALTHGHQKRDFIYLDDVVNAYIKIIQHGTTEKFPTKIFELGTGDSVEVRKFVELLKEISSSKTTLSFGDIPYRSDEIMDSKADISALQQLGWSSEVKIKSGIEKILKAYKLNCGIG